MRRFFDFLFPFDSPGKNAVLATFYISSIPNILLAFIPSEISPSTMNIMTAFAAGGLLSDVFVHLIPHSFMGGEEHGGVQFILVEEKRNVLIGLAIFLGFAFFYATEKLSRTFGGGDEHGHSHSHSHSHSHGSEPEVKPSAVSSSVEKHASDDIRKRGSNLHAGETSVDTPSSPTVQNGPSKLSAYLNLWVSMGDFMHNITDGLVIAASFYSSPLIGATSTLACFAHEIPHEIADFSILVRSGFTKRQAMGSQFITAIGAFCGTFLGIAIEQAAASSSHASSHDVDLSAAVRGTAPGILGTTVQPSELVIPAIAGGFIYIATVAVVPVLLQENRGFKQAMKEFGAMGFGVACMVLVAWNE
ncbi:hypothetical protein M407DRAFT_220618 [Tulasnella calospora MUT 4182]|uniref:Uncharacterized protein n=1 Tax=Tulasnella calospora MUT 4182 TaxID=1051891 RepID=A0A0C3PYN4_9AGAM|nr:hypothetical protein M407DRAFT_220618 [Tulasnella calospora MUT 4182]